MLIWGWKRYVERLAVLTLVCGNCSNPAAHVLHKLVTKFTLFFIPLIPLSTKHSLQCTWCGAESPIAPQQLPDLVSRAQMENMTHQQTPAPGTHWQTQPPHQY